MDNIKCDLNDIVFPPVGIAHITSNIADLVQYDISGKKRIHVHCASQPNSYPHLGTITTLMTAFAVAEHIGDYYGLTPEVRFEEIDNSPAEKVIKNGVTYSRSVKQVKESDLAKNEKYMRVFKYVFEFISKKTNVGFSIRPFSDYQNLPFVRRQLIKILDNESDFVPIFSPSEKRLHLRVQCLKCGFVDKAGINLQRRKLSNGSYELKSVCFEHGEHASVLSETSSDFTDTNTPITDVIQEALFIEEDTAANAISVMVDGNDWSGVWSLNVFTRGLCMLGYDFLKRPLHFYAPLITDWSGAKFSKSVYVSSHTYDYLPQELVDFSKFLDSWGEKGLEILWEEVACWVSEPKRFFRDYSVDYFKLLFDKKLNEYSN